jgi:hypothetical protein
MREIYRGAKQVTVCLGDAPDAHLALYLLGKIYFAKYLWKSSEEKIYDMYRRHGTRGILPWLALGKLISNPYWDRVWIIQEFASATKMEVVYGRRVISWIKLLLVMRVFTNIYMVNLLGSTEDPMILRKPPLDKLGHAFALQFFQERMQQNMPLSLIEVLAISNGFKATNPRDMIFALIGLTDDPIHPLVAPNYNKSIREVFRDTARFILCRKGSKDPLFFMSYAGSGHPRLEKDLPSWVPDWTKPVQPLTHGAVFPKYHASGDSSPRFSLSLDTDIIILGGLMVDKIYQLSPYNEEAFAEAETFKGSDVFNTSRRYKGPQNLATECLKSPYVNGQPLSDAFWRAAMGDATDNERPAHEIYKEYFDCFNEIFDQEKDSRLEKVLRDFETFGDVPDIDYLEAQIEEGGSDRYLEKVAKSTKYAAMANRVSLYRRFCITKKGYIGWVPRFSQVGDLVGIIDGEPTPYIVRRCEKSTTNLDAIASPDIARFLVSCWTRGGTCYVDRDNWLEKIETTQFLLVGACYMHAMMDGEMLQAGTPQPLIFR